MKDIFDTALNNVINYDEKSCVENVLKNINHLETLRQTNNQTAIAIIIDFKNAINQLTDDEKDLIRLRYIEQYTLQEIGKIKNVSYVTIYRNLNNVINDIYKNLKYGY